MTTKSVTNVVIAGLGGQGVLTASDILADVAFRAGYDVKKSEIHGMSQRGGSVTSDVRFGTDVQSPMVPGGAADYLVVVSPDQVQTVRHELAADGVLIEADIIDMKALPNAKSLNVAMLGALSVHLPIDRAVWIEAIEGRFPAKLHASNEAAFNAGREAVGLSTQK